MAVSGDHSIDLPEITLSFTLQQWESELLLVTGGRPPTVDWLRETATGRTLWCADHGVDVCRRAELCPVYLIGDADSADAEAWQWAERQGAVSETFPPEKDFTDTELALQKMRKERPGPFVAIIGAFGGRLDHAFSTLYSLVGSGLPGLLADDKELLLLLRSGDAITGQTKKTPLALSLLPLSKECSGVSLTGVRWPLCDARLTQDCPNAVSNRLASPEGRFSLSLQKGCLALYVCWKTPPW